MYSKLELEVVKNHLVEGFSTYLQGAYFEFPKLKSDISKENYPSRKQVIKVLDSMQRNRDEFDFEYDDLTNEDTNPLKLEQEAWGLLSQRVTDYLSKFRRFINSYSPKKVTDESKKRFLEFQNEGWDLLQKWNIISRLYNCKYEVAIYEKTGWTENDLLEREEAVKDLIRDLSSQT